MDFLAVVGGWIGAALSVLSAFWQWIALGVVLAVVGLVVRRVEKRWDEHKAAERIRKAEREKAAASEKKARDWSDFLRLETGRNMTRWHVTKDESDPYVWVLTNGWRDQARHVCVGVYPDGLNKADNLSFEVGHVESLGEVRVRISDPAQAESTFFALSWSDTSPTEQFQTLSLAGAVQR
ncbi:hypothetical protein [Arthrobacter sp. B2a2-09]|uniref:hypothetical protein n=1 Tax=Arthrobacter sp. B2a2-09 TaxID=2952822 RepID=UPI0022CD60D6|nr:hypothetical protein [Arthrobacter sp. B2a2-09]MCZ9884630.1 hypothetical protein [Arthrobacter sp. B2a2-09]